jgi:LmbE family N-acetylglucosaminyl deacetylase
MAETLKLMCILAHPDDESLGTGGTLAKYAAEGVETYLVTATRGERGWTGEPGAYPGSRALGTLREAELREAATTLGLRHVDFLDYVDGELDQADPTEAVARIACHIRRVRPHVVITFGPDGAYGHPDHIAISQLTTTAVVYAAGESGLAGQAPHRVTKLYYMATSAELATAYEAAFGALRMSIDGEERHIVTWPGWSITTRIDAGAYWRIVWRAVACHRSQLPNYDRLVALDEHGHRRLWGCQSYYRAFSLVNGGRTPEDDLFAGLREPIGTAVEHPSTEGL